jgi:hypothetical protein
MTVTFFFFASGSNCNASSEVDHSLESFVPHKTGNRGYNNIERKKKIMVKAEIGEISSGRFDRAVSFSYLLQVLLIKIKAGNIMFPGKVNGDGAADHTRTQNGNHHTERF